MSKTIDQIFDDYIQKNYPNVKPIPIKSQTYLGTTTFEDVFKSLIIDKAKKYGYYK